MKLFPLFIALVLLASCGKNYSPLDNYIKATIESDSLNLKAEKDAREWLNNALIKTKYVCPDCGEWGCIYEDIDTAAGEGTDAEIEAAIQAICKERGIVDPEIINLLRANYYL